jgi:hypothetical protein
MNYAHSGNIVFERGDGESVPDFRDRVRSLVADLGGGVLAWGAPEGLEWIEAAPETIDIAGGLKDDATGDFAQIGGALIERGDGELIEAFRARARARPFGLGKSIVFGGLRPMPTDDSSSEVNTEQP